MIIYLYKKTHNKTGLQYLGKTKEDPLKYRGSGKDWKPHIKEHGYDVTTEIVRECLTKKELSYWGRYYSKLWNIVEDPNWANKIPETGGGGHWSGRVLTEEHKQKMRGQRGPISPETRAKRLGRKRGPSPLKGVFKHSEEAKSRMRVPKKEVHGEKLREVAKNRPRSPCAICGKLYQPQHMGRHMKSHQATTL